jgi:integrase
MATVKKRQWQTKSGTSEAWVVRYYDAKGERRSEQFDTKTEANGRKVDIETELRAGVHTALSESPSVRQIGEAWFAVREAEQLEPATLRSYRSKLKNHIYPLIGSKKIAMLAAPDLEDIKGKLLERTSIANARAILAQIRMMFNHAETSGKTSKNVARSVRLKRGKREKKGRVAIPTKAEAGALLKRAMPPEPQAMTYAAAYAVSAHFTGMRASEQRGLQWPKVALAGPNPCIVIDERADETGKLGSCKSDSSYRTIPLGPSVVAVLRRWKLVCPKPPKGQPALVFPNGAGRVELLPNIRTRVWVPLFWKPGEPGVLAQPYYTPHVARHFYASLLIDQGFAPKQVQERMGHSSIQVTMDIYGHLFRDKENEQAQATMLEKAIDW